MRRPFKLLVALLCALAMFATACGSGDDGAQVRDLGSDDDAPVAGSASSSSAGSSSGSSSGVSTAEAADTPGDGGYEYVSNVDSHRLVVADICEIAEALDAGEWDTAEALYRDGKNSVNSDDSIRSIGGFASRDDRSHGLSEFYGTPAPLDEFITSAFDGSGDFAGEDDGVRAQGVEKGIQNQTMVAWTIHELNSALAKAADGNFDIDSGAVHNWDEGWAFFHGAEAGCAPYATGNKRAGNFGTVGDGEIALANEAILAAMIEGRDALVAEDAAAAEAAAGKVVKNVAITYSQATVRYAHLIAGDLAEGDDATAREHQAEGYAFWRVMEAVLVGNGADGDTINNILGLGSAPGANGGSADIRAALAPAWDALGITEADIGWLEEEDGALSSPSSSGSGISADELAQGTDNPLIQDAVDGYRSYVQDQIVTIQAETKIFADAVRSGDIDAAKDAYPISRRAWERIEPIAGLIEDIDGAVDAREDDFASPEDPAFTGWHRLEYHLWILVDVSEAGPFADQLEAVLQILADSAGDLDLPPGVLTVGAQELIEEVAAPDGKLSGEEDRYSGTDLYDFKANVEGAEALVELMAPALTEADPALLAEIEALFDDLNGQLGDLGSFESGFVDYNEVTEDQKSEFAATLGELAESLSLLNGVLGLA